MANTLFDLYLKYRNKVSRSLENDNYYQYLFDLIEGGEKTLQQTNRILHKEVDERWLTKVEECLNDIDEIIGHPRRFITTNETVVPVELARKITADSVRHLSQNTHLISSIDDGMVRPSKILNVTTEESYDLYENRFIFTLIKKLVRFIDKRTDIIFWSTGDEQESVLKVDSQLADDYEEISYTLEMKVKNKQSYLETDAQHIEVFKRIDRVRRIVMEFNRSPFMQLMNGCSQVRSPIQRTNAIMKDPHYKKCYSLWQFLEQYDEVGYSIDVKETALDFDEEYLYQVYGNIIMNYTVFKTILEDDHRPIDANVKRRKKIKPKFIKQIVEEFVDDYDLPDVEIRRVLVEEITKAQLEIEKRQAEQEKKKAEREKARLKAQAEKEKQKEKERLAKEKEKERLKALADKEKAKQKAAEEREKARLKALAEKEKEKEKAAKEREQARLKAQAEKEKQKEKERLAKEKEKARLKAQAEKEKQKEKERLAKEKEKERQKALADKEKAKQKAAQEKEKERLKAQAEKEKQKALAEKEKERQKALAEQEKGKQKAVQTRDKAQSKVPAANEKQEETEQPVTIEPTAPRKAASAVEQKPEQAELEKVRETTPENRQEEPRNDTGSTGLESEEEPVTHVLKPMHLQAPEDRGRERWEELTLRDAQREQERMERERQRQQERELRAAQWEEERKAREEQREKQRLERERLEKEKLDKEQQKNAASEDRSDEDAQFGNERNGDA